MVCTTRTSVRAQAAATAMAAAARRATATLTNSPPHQSPCPSSPLTPVPDDPDGDAGGDGNPGGGGGNNPGNPDGGGGPPDDDGDEPEDPDFDDENPPNLAVAINKLANSVRRPTESKTKVREPDTFDGSDPKKLRNFRVQCELNFQDREKAFRTGKSKATYALSFLRGSALEWFEPSILDSSHPDWEDDYKTFEDELRTNFGPYDPVGDAKIT